MRVKSGSLRRDLRSPALLLRHQHRCILRRPRKRQGTRHRWDVDEISKLILDFRADGTGTIEVPEVRVRIPITYLLQGDELTITQAPAQGIDIGACMVLERLENAWQSIFRG